ncbi:hypothetical protein EXIGLDRAFT_730115 [Exidia glandulosa HHB12029]|uniref:Uncharacterized protein n=1 Tax=Exidia glandulosa HHB12029 TaxID=1314781 RepID=A0A165CBR9_EXIGL|nr:hypothetical protein EXIGLDRAFT_730115 [Exidia glandulosa HHB12029]
MTSAPNNNKLATVYDGLAAQLDECAAVLRHDLEAAEAALVHAREKVDEIRRNLDDVTRRQEDLRASSVTLRASQRPTFPRTFPVELLCAVFQAFVGEATSLWDGWYTKCDIDKQRRTAPFILAAVCRRWRAVTLATPSLWYYIALPPPTSVLDCHTSMYYVDTVLARSRTSPLEIAVDWEHLTDAQWTELRDDTQPLLRRVADAASRWRIVFVLLPNLAATRENLDDFRRVMPMLEELVVCREDEDGANLWAGDFPVYLPRCPKLRRMRTDGCHIVWTAYNFPPMLVHLELEVHLPINVIWDLLQYLPVLEALDLDLPEDPVMNWTPPTDQKLQLPALRDLEINRMADHLLSEWAPYMELPSLRSCRLAYVDYDNLRPFLEVFADSITTLAIYTMEVSTNPAAMPELRNLRQLDIGHCDAGYDYTFSTLARTDVWPELETVELQDLEISTEFASALIEFVRARHPKRLNTVRLKSCNAPTWFLEQLELFLRDSKAGPQQA